MKTRLLKAVSLIVISFVCSTSRATLIGDTITLDVVYAGAPIPSVNDHKVVTVQAGSGDVVQMGVMDQFFAVNPETDTIFVTFNREADGTGSFFGLSITGIDETLLGSPFPRTRTCPGRLRSSGIQTVRPLYGTTIQSWSTGPMCSSGKEIILISLSSRAGQSQTVERRQFCLGRRSSSSSDSDAGYASAQSDRVRSALTSEKGPKGSGFKGVRF